MSDIEKQTTRTRDHESDGTSDTSSTTVVDIHSLSDALTVSSIRTDPFGLGFTRLLLAHVGYVPHTLAHPETPSRLVPVELISLTLFVEKLIPTIVSTSLPTITSSLPGPSTLYPWVGTSYLAAQTLIQPILAKICVFAGFKSTLYFSVAIFMLASAGSGAAGSLYQLVVFRAFQGVGAGGIITVVWTILTKLVYPENRSRWQPFLSMTWALSAAAGPLLGGVFSDTVSWRWGFFINLPAGALALGLVLPCLWRVKLDDDIGDSKCRSADAKNVFWQFDFIGLALIAGGALMLMFGLSEASGTTWTPTSIGLCAGGIVTLVIALLYEAFLTDYGVIPAAFFQDRTIGVIMLVSFLQTFTYTAITYYLVLYFQAVMGVNALVAGLSILPMSLTCAILSAPISIYLSPHVPLKWLIVFGYGLTALGFGCMITLDENTHMALRECLPLIVGIGFGFLLKLPNDLLTIVLRDKHLASANGNFFLVRTMGCTTGLSIASALFDTRLQANLATTSYLLDPSDVDWRQLIQIQPVELRSQVLHAVSRALGVRT
ncbi:MFS general substrate transporter [Clavulina sp. PMI_390]|nr:MFS general substrate transporter [Clavulina sp. PMI_390]